MFTENKKILPQDIGGGVTRKILSYSQNLMTVELSFPKGATGAKHSHPHEQIGYIISGSLIYQEEGQEDKVLGTHGVEILEDTMLLDIFTPMREDFIQK